MTSKLSLRPLGFLDGLKNPFGHRFLSQFSLRDHGIGQSAGHAMNSTAIVSFHPLYHGDSCPECHHTLERHGRTFSNLYLREPFLQCTNCRLILRKRSRH